MSSSGEVKKDKKKKKKVVKEIVHVLRIKVIAGIDLPVADLNGFSDPYTLVSFEGRVFKTKIVKKNLNPVWDEEFAIEMGKQERTFVKFSVYDYDKLTADDFLGSVQIKIKDYMDGEPHPLTLDLKIVEKGEEKVTGKIQVSIQVQKRKEIERDFWRSMVKAIGVLDKKPKLTREQLALLFEGVGMVMDDEELDKKFKEIDTNQDNSISIKELVNAFEGKTSEIARSRIKKDGKDTDEATLTAKAYSNIVSNEGVVQEGDSFAMGGFMTESYATRGFKERLIHRVLLGKYAINEETGNIIVQDRESGALVEEKMPGFVRMGIRVLYQNDLNNHVLKMFFRTLRKMSEHQGEIYTNPKSVQQISPFIDFHQLNMDEYIDPISSYKNFNEFFYRKIKPEARPIDKIDNPDVAVSPADARCVVFENVEQAREFWIKGEKFNIADFIQNPELTEKFDKCSIAIFRLAPQDYHRFHHPVDGKIISMTPIEGEYLTVNPMAIRSDIDVFLKNKRHVTVIESPSYGTVIFVSIGATLVGSINFTKDVGDEVKKGEEHGYFAFGGSTVIVLFQANITFDDDLVKTSLGSMETLIKMGNRIGVAKKNN